MSPSFYSKLWNTGLRAASHYTQLTCRKSYMYCLVLAIIAISDIVALSQERPRTFTNPINIDYRFQTVSRIGEKPLIRLLCYTKMNITFLRPQQVDTGILQT